MSKQKGIHELLKERIDGTIMNPQVRKVFANSVSMITRHYKNSAAVELDIEVYNISNSQIPMHMSSTLIIPVQAIETSVNNAISTINRELQQGTLHNATTGALDSLIVQSICKLIYPQLAPQGFPQVFVVHARRPKGY